MFGPFGKPFYNSVIATFSHQITNEQVPEIKVDSELKLIYVGELVSVILKKIKERKNKKTENIQKYVIFRYMMPRQWILKFPYLFVF